MKINKRDFIIAMGNTNSKVGQKMKDGNKSRDDTDLAKYTRLQIYRILRLSRYSYEGC